MTSLTSLYYLLAGATTTSAAVYLSRPFFAGGVCKINTDQTGKVFVITGSNTGIGQETARQVAKLNGTVILANRSEERSANLLKELQDKHGKERCEFIKLDLSDTNSVRQFADDFKFKYQRLDGLLNNAGLFNLPQRQETKQGFEMQFGTNHIGHFLLTGLLLDPLKNTPESRVVCVSSQSHEGLFGKYKEINFDDLQLKNNYTGMAAYSYSKLANVMFAKELQRRFDNNGINSKVVTLNPGIVRTEVHRHLLDKPIKKFVYSYLFMPIFSIFTKNVQQGAQTNLHCLLESHNNIQGGAYYQDCKVKASSQESLNVSNQKKLFEISEKLADFKYNI